MEEGEKEAWKRIIVFLKEEAEEHPESKKGYCVIDEKRGSITFLVCEE